jgi:hypothetical protein
VFKSIGFEVELDLFGGFNDKFFDCYRRAFRWEREYYYHQVERNDFLFNVEDLNDLYGILNYMNKSIISEIKDISYDTDYWIPLNSIYSDVCGSVVSNGIHIHIGGEEFMEEFVRYAVDNDLSLGYVYNKFRQFIVRNYIDIFGLSGRFVFSHHIWGNYRDSSYEFKRKRKFRPALFRYEHNTFEFRLFNLEDLFEVEKMCKFFKKIYNFKVEKIDRVRKCRTQNRLEKINSECDESWIEFFEKEKDKFKESEELNYNDECFFISQEVRLVKQFDDTFKSRDECNRIYFYL